ncbi:Fe2+ or Zn2+ uptake regulation protein [Dysgonomonadaceae bacterium PH5-43]|nr:Fe2+ or Zn2+ uptake regulation protein [Dysgonomonadaceae bacterium PH5-43]
MLIQAKERLLEYGVKPSLQRIAIMNYLINNAVHPTVDRVFNELYPSMPTLSKTTVYNTLKLFEEHGAVQSISIDEKNIRYDADLSFHAHFKCKHCGEVYDINLEQNDLLNVKNNKDLVFTECQVYYKGYCSECKNKI